MSEQDQREANLAAVATAVSAAQTAANHGERLAVVETQVKGIAGDIRLVRSDLIDVKADVKTLLASDNRFQGGSSLIGKAAPWVALAVAIVAAVRGS